MPMLDNKFIFQIIAGKRMQIKEVNNGTDRFQNRESKRR